jgi:hypothetical protein
MTSERFNKELSTPRWEPLKKGMANHYWDCEVYQVVAAVGFGVRLPGIESKPVPANKPKPPGPKPPTRRPRVNQAATPARRTIRRRY